MWPLNRILLSNRRSTLVESASLALVFVFSYNTNGARDDCKDIKDAAYVRLNSKVVYGPQYTRKCDDAL